MGRSRAQPRISLGIATLVTALSVSVDRSEAAEGDSAVVYVSDMGKCRPASVLSATSEQDKWQLVPYESTEVSGTMIGAASYIDAPDVTLPLNVSGWHAVHIGFWNPYYMYDGGTTVKVRFSDRRGFVRIREGQRCVSQQETAIQEVFLEYADLTGRDIVFGKTNGALGRKAYIAYVRLRPLSAEEVVSVKDDRARTDTRRLTVSIDGMSYLHKEEFSRPEQIRDLIEPYRHSDVGRVLWAVCYGDRTNYPSAVGRFEGRDDSRVAHVRGNGTNAYIVGQTSLWRSLRAFAKAGVMPQAVAAEHAHEIGLEFDLMFRLGIGGELPPRRQPGGDGFVVRHPQFRQVLRDGTLVEKASYAFPEVQQFMLSLIREATQTFDADGINLCFVRGPHFLRYETPVLDAFRVKHDEDARNVEPTDPRLLAVKAEIMSRFVRQARGVLDEVGRAKGKRLGLSVWVWPTKQNVWCGRTPAEEGLDVRGWVTEGLLDSVICQQGADPDLMALGRKHDCRFVLFTGYRGEKQMSPATIAAAYGAGVNEFAYWDADFAQDSPPVWEWLRRIGHRQEMESWSDDDCRMRRVPLKAVGGCSVGPGVSLQQAVYSGG